MRCEQARQLFDAYLDGELSPTLRTELGAHRVRCAECRRALALLEVSGHVIQSDGDPVEVCEGFSDRLLACVDTSKRRWTHRTRRALYVVGPLAAAAVIALAFLGVFDGREAMVAGEKVQRQAAGQLDPSPEPLGAQTDVGADVGADVDADVDPMPTGEPPLEDWLARTRDNMNNKFESSQSLQRYMDLTILQWLDILNSAANTSAGENHFPGSDDLTEPTDGEVDPVDEDGVEDL